MQRRELLASLGTVATGGIVLTQMTNPANAQVTIDGLSVADETVETTTDISSVDLEVNGQVDYTTNSDPTRIVIRLEAAPHDGDYTQITATEIDTTSSDYTVSGGLEDVIDMDNIMPSDPGGENNITLDFRVGLEVYVDGSEVASATSTDTATLTVQHGSVSVEASIGGDGGIMVETATS